MDEKTFELIVVGNGFDLNQGYKTSYRNFFEFCKNAIKKDFNELSQILIKEQYITEEELKERELPLNALQETIKNGNLYLDYFFTIQKRFNEWSDVESELFNILSNLKRTISNLKKLYVQDFIWDNNSIIYKIVDHNEYEFLRNFHRKGVFYCHKDSENLLTISIIDQNQTYDHDRCEEEEYLKYYSDMNLDKLPFLFYTELKSFEKLFSEYLKIFATPRKERRHLNLKCGVIWNYNYTSIADSYFECEEINIFHIHGKINHQGNYNDIVFGIDNKQAEKLGGDFTLFSKSVRRTINNTDYQRWRGFYDGCRSIAFFGHSLSPMDDDSIVDLIESSKNNLENLTVYYTNKCPFDKEKHIMSLKRILGDEYFNKIRPCTHFICCD